MTNTQKTETKTETSSSTKPGAQLPANPFAAFIPAFDPAHMAQMTSMFAPQQFSALWTETLARTQQAAEQFGAFEKDMLARAQTAVQTWSQLAQDAIAYAGQLSVEARKLGLETAKKLSPNA